MNEYPEALLRRVAKAISPDAWEPESPAHWKEYALDQAEAALDALGLREELQDAQTYKDSTRHRYVTEWEDA